MQRGNKGSSWKLIQNFAETKTKADPEETLETYKQKADPEETIETYKQKAGPEETVDGCKQTSEIKSK